MDNSTAAANIPKLLRIELNRYGERSSVRTGQSVAEVEARVRTPWATGHPLLTEYYDTEWGMPVRDEAGVYERLVLEGFQAGLSWLTVLKKRDAFRRAFKGFDPDIVAGFSAADLTRLLGDDEIIRNRQKIEAAIHNARATVALRGQEYEHLGELVWSFQPETTPTPTLHSEFPSESEESRDLARLLKQHGFKFVGPTTVYAMMAAIGIVDLHAVESFRRGCSGLWNEDGTRTIG